MATRFLCEDERRRSAVRFPVDGNGAPTAPVINGIDYLEVGASQRTLFVHFVHPLPGQAGEVPPAGTPLAAANVAIDGGVRVTGIRVQSVAAAAEVLTVTVDSPGDFSAYRLRLVGSGVDATPPAGFDTHLAEIAFSFKVDCPSDFDCGHGGACPTPVLPVPPIDYLAKDYASFRRLMLDRLAVVTPDWSERNVADVGVMTVELLAYVADQLSYRQDAVATEAYIGTARRRASIRRHARLVDYAMHDGINARAWVCLEVAQDLFPIGPDVPLLDAGHVFLTRGDGPITIKPEDLRRALSDGPVVFESVHPVERLTVARNRIDLYTWSDARCCLPVGATAATLDGTAATLGLAAGDVLVFEEVVGPDSGLAADADPAHRQAVRLDRDPTEVVDRLTGRHVLEVSWFADDAIRLPVCAWDVPDPGGTLHRVSVARANVVLVDHGQTITGSEDTPGLTPSVVPDRGRYRPVLTEPDLTQRIPYDAAAARRASATAAIAGDPRAASPAIEIDGDGERWFPERDLLSTDRFDPKFVVELESDGRSTVRFGDDVRGRRPAAGTSMVATYRVGTGSAGNVGGDAIGRMVGAQGIADADIVHVWNPLAATGGTDPEALEQVRLYASQAFRTQERAVTDADYAAMAGRHPAVQRAAATRRWTGSWHTMFVTTDRRAGGAVDETFENELRAFLERFRMAGHDLEVDPPRFVPLDIVLTVCALPGYVRADVERALFERFGTGLRADGSRGFFHPDESTFGQPVYLSRFIAAAMQVTGVSWVDIDDTNGKPNRFQRWGQPANGEIEAGRIDMQRLEIARLDNDPSRPENGHLQFLMSGGI